MSGIAHLCDHRVVVYRENAVRDEFGDTVPVWTALTAPSGRNARATLTESGTLTDYGPGEQQAPHQRWFLLPAFDVRERDVLSVDAGARAPRLLRVEKVIPATHPRSVHHIEVDVTEWAGRLTEPAEVS